MGRRGKKRKVWKGEKEREERKRKRDEKGDEEKR